MRNHLMKTTLIGGRQGTGKTETLINYLSNKNTNVLLFSFDHAPTNPHFFNLPDNITVFGQPDLSFENITALVQEKLPDIIAIDSVDVLPEAIANHNFIDKLKNYCQELVLTSHLSDDDELNTLTAEMVTGEDYDFVRV